MPEYCSLAEVHQRMPELGASDDALLTSMVYAVSSYFDETTQRRFDSETSVHIVTGGEMFAGGGLGRSKLFLRPPLASAPTQVRIRDNAKGSWRIVPIGDVKLMPEGRRSGDPILWLQLIDTPTGTDSVWPSSDDSVEITGTWGRSTVPDDIREACIQTVVNLYRSRGSAGSDMEVGIGGTYMPAIVKAMPHFAWAILQNYKRLVYA